MTIQLRLDAQALEALFPEGTEARLELQKAVVSEFARRHFMNTVSADVKALIMNQREAVVQQVIQSLRGTTFSASPLSGPFKDQIREEVKKSIQEFVTGALRTEMDKTTKEILDDIGPVVTQQIESKTNAQIDKAVRERFESALKKVGQ